ncbi:MAG: YtxH domain-containing protein [Gemmatimonadota bacterium]
MADHEDGYVIIERRTGNFGTFVWGLLVGAAAALLFAPKSGRETVEELTDSFYRLRDEAENRAREVQDSVNTAVQDVRRQLNDGVETARRAVASGREAARATRDEMERQVSESKEAFRAGYDAARAASGETGQPMEGEDEPTTA